VVANLVNMHSGFNGLAPGLSLMVLSTLLVKTWFHGDIFNALFILCLTGALAGYFLFEKYPAQIFWGNVGALSVGAAIGANQMGKRGAMRHYLLRKLPGKPLKKDGSQLLA
jgi:UDP-N-acetylglucosamine--dolichyl-phosphate N-acetylglucosaminephosphotransferase